MEISSVFVAGAGYMGNGIAQMAALAGYDVIMHDITSERLTRGREAIRDSLGRFLARGRISETDGEAAISRLRTTTDLAEASGAELVVEAIPEDLEMKRSLFKVLDGICPDGAILATNTSAIPISAIAGATKRPEQVVGTHFFGPVPVMRLCEIIRGIRTSDAVLDTADAWARSLGKETVLVKWDHAGFIANRLNIPSTLQMVRMVEEGMTPSDIDAAATFQAEGRVGPLEILDNAGIDITISAATAIFNDTADPKFFPPPLLRRMAAAGLLGRKSGRGFYDYASGKKAAYDLLGDTGRARLQQTAGDARLTYRMFLPSIVEAVLMIQAGVANPEDIDKATRLGFNFPMGPLEMADNIGLDVIKEEADSIFAETGDSKYFLPALLRNMVRRGILGRKSGQGFYSYSQS